MAARCPVRTDRKATGFRSMHWDTPFHETRRKHFGNRLLRQRVQQETASAHKGRASYKHERTIPRAPR